MTYVDAAVGVASASRRAATAAAISATAPLPAVAPYAPPQLAAAPQSILFSGQLPVAQLPGALLLQPLLVAPLLPRLPMAPAPVVAEAGAAAVGVAEPLPAAPLPPMAAPDRTGKGQWVHWVFVTDCSAYMFNQGNIMLASAYHVNQPGEFTWIVYGCQRESQRQELLKLRHSRAKVWHAHEQGMVHPVTGKLYKPFQASNRPIAINAWWRAVQPPEEAIGILDPDEMFMRPVVLLDSALEGPVQSEPGGPWITRPAVPKHGSGARYGIGCIPARWTNAKVLEICGQEGEEAARCLKVKKSPETCTEEYSSGPPWILHRDDVNEVFGKWIDTAIMVHDTWSDMLAEQAAYGITQMRFGVTNTLDSFWFLSSVTEDSQPWSQAAKTGWNPCRARAPPPVYLPMPPLWHACSAYQIPHLPQSFNLHKDHIHKDFLDCDAPLLLYAPLKALDRYNGDWRNQDWRRTWSVCTYISMVNFYAASWKRKFCKYPNLNASSRIHDGSSGALNPKSRTLSIFRRGGWSDIDYELGKS